MLEEIIKKFRKRYVVNTIFPVIRGNTSSKDVEDFIEEEIKKILYSFPQSTTIDGTQLCIPKNDVDKWIKRVLNIDNKNKK